MYETTLLEKRTVAEGTIEFTLARPEGFTFQAGQSLDLKLINPPETDAEGNVRSFSIASAPHEPNLSVAIRMRNTAFKRVLARVPEGTALTIDGPFGFLVLPDTTERTYVFFAGGIGITLFHSIVKDVMARALPHRIVLFYANRRPEDAAYLAELQAFAKENPRFTLVATMTEMEKSVLPWEGERGYVDAPMVRRYVPERERPVCYIAGPTPMLMAMREMLRGMGVPDSDVHFELYSGY